MRRSIRTRSAIIGATATSGDVDIEDDTGSEQHNQSYQKLVPGAAGLDSMRLTSGVVFGPREFQADNSFPRTSSAMAFQRLFGSGRPFHPVSSLQCPIRIVGYDQPQVITVTIECSRAGTNCGAGPGCASFYA